MVSAEARALGEHMSKLKDLEPLYNLYNEKMRKLGPRSEAEWNYLDIMLPTLAPDGSLARHLARMLFMIPQIGEPITPAIRTQLQYDFSKCTALLENPLDLIEAGTVWLIIRAWRKYMNWADQNWLLNPGPFIDAEQELRQRIERDLGIHIE
jgi:hypothetical protein